MKKLYLFFLAALFATSPILAQSITTSPLTVGPITANFGSAYQNIPFSGNVTSSGIIGGVPPYFCSKVSGAFPTGIADVTSGCLVVGTPTGTSSGTEVVKIADSGNSTLTFSVTINVALLNSLTVASSSNITSILSGNKLQLSCTANWNNGTASDITSLTTWASSNTSIFTVNNGGAFPGLVTGISAGSANATCAFNSITSANYGITVTSTNPVVVQTASLPNCQQNLSYQSPTGFQLTATGGAPPYTWTQTGGTLPTGLSLTTSGLILGTCTGSTASSLVFKATDTASANGSSGSLTLTVATLSSITVTPTTPTINAGAQQQFTAIGTYSDSSTANLSNGSSGLGLINTATSGSSGGTTGTSSVTPSFPAIAGNLLWVECVHGTDTTTTCTPTDTASNSFTSITSKTNAPVGFVQTFYAKNITGNSADVVTCTFNNPVAFRTCAVHQITGASTTAPLDSSSVVSANSSSAGNAATTPSFSTATANEVEDIAFFIDSSTTTISPGIGYAIRVSSGDAGSEDQTFSSTQSSITGSISWTGSALDWIIIGQAFEAATAGNGCQWTSSSLTVATVGATGLVTSGTGNGGTSTIKCAVGAVNGTTLLTVTPSAVTTLTISPALVSIGIGGQSSFICTDNNGNNLTATATFGSNNTSVFQFGSPNGTGTAIAAGSAVATCSSNGVTSNTATVTVGSAFTAATCNYADVNAVINGPTHTAVDGDIINIPAGTCTWATALLISKGISVIGAGSAQTVINSSHSGTLIGITLASSTEFARWSGVTIQPLSGTTDLGRAPIMVLHGTCSSATCSHIRVDNNLWTGWLLNVTYDSWLAEIDNAFGVYDHNTVSNFDGGLFNMALSSYQGIGTFGDNSWAQPDTFGTDNNFYFETNTINALGQLSALTDADVGGGPRFVVRFNNMNNVDIQTHGTESSGRIRSARHVEFYNNAYTVPSGSQITGIGLRGGTTYAFNNTFTGAGQFNGEVSMTDYRIGTNFGPWGSCSGEGPYDLNDGVTYASGTITASTGSGQNQIVTDSTRSDLAQYFNTTNPYSMIDETISGQDGFEIDLAGTANTVKTFSYAAWSGGSGAANTFRVGDAYAIKRASICIDQPGRGQGVLLSGSTPTPTGWVNEALDPVYEWGSSVNGSHAHTFVGLNWNIKFQENKDYYQQQASFNGTVGTGSGVLASRPATCTVGVAYWATDQGNWNNSGSGGQGQLYICTATNTWTLSYTPFTYPHPLISGGTAMPGVSFSPPSCNFGSVIVGGSPGTCIVTINNGGTASLTITAITISGTNSADFSFTPTSCSAVPILIAAGGNCTITASFAPAATGTRSAFLNFTDNAAGSPQQVGLSGTGSTSGGSPVTLVSSAFYNAPCANGSTTCATSSFTVAHTGDAVYLYFGFCVNGSCSATPTGTFSVSDGTNTYTLVANASSTSNSNLIEQVFVAKNATAGTYTATLTATSDSLDYTHAAFADLQNANTGTPVDASVSKAVNASTTTSITSAGNVTNANEIILVAASCLGANNSITNSGTYTTLGSSTPSGVIFMDLVHPSSGASTTAANTCTTASYSASMVGITP